ncbi:3-hydroxybutyryl-CoA dehydrogenase [Streptomyces sodiiphilus]|uniref:3-hydroxybutyryl-CoA dehydrogenase n=1 Tax=Streptomyces sodiiphilus TaxID=226217 RepID=A0ABN2PDA4_9ACTN
MSRRFATVSVIGLGTTGSAVAGMLARSGRRVICIEAHAAALERARGRIADAGAGEVEFSLCVADAARSDLVIEAVPERMEIKRAVLERAVAACSPRTVFVTTTGGLSVTELAFAVGCTERLAGLHLFPGGDDSGELAMEVVATPLTAGQVLTDLEELVHDMDGSPVRVADRAGFLGSGLTMAYLNSAVAMHEQGYATRDSIDTAMRLGCGLRRGPLAQLDAMGIDTARDTLEALYRRTGDRRYQPQQTLGQMVSAGLLGRKSGRGFYDYSQSAERDSSPEGGDPAPARGAQRAVRTIGVVGSGVMAMGIAEVCARAGYRTVLVARTGSRAAEAVQAVVRSTDRAVQRGKLTPGMRAEVRERLTGAFGFEALAACELVIEAVAEDIDVKRSVFAGLDRVCAPGAVLATSTSSLPVIECARATGRPEDVVGMHFFNPAPVMRLVEVARTVLTSPEALETVHGVTRRLGKQAVECRDRTGFIVNALLFPYLNAAVTMLRDGRESAADIDEVMVKGGVFPVGPLQLLDIVGLDISLAIQRSLYAAFRDPSLEPARYLEQFVAAGYTGRKSGRGFRTTGGTASAGSSRNGSDVVGAPA